MLGRTEGQAWELSNIVLPDARWHEHTVGSVLRNRLGFLNRPVAAMTASAPVYCRHMLASAPDRIDPLQITGMPTARLIALTAAQSAGPSCSLWSFNLPWMQSAATPTLKRKRHTTQKMDDRRDHLRTRVFGQH